MVADVDRDGSGGETHGEDEEVSSDDFFDASEGPIIGLDRLSLRAASESVQVKVAAAAAPKTSPSVQ